MTAFNERNGAVNDFGAVVLIRSNRRKYLMICTTIRNGEECVFMTASGCSYNGGQCHQVVEACTGCHRSKQFESGWFCSAAPDPSVKWKYGNCNMATHVIMTVKQEKAKLNPIKASKRGNK
jgi:hypothetical protein